MKVIIIGAGIAGLSTYLALQAYLPRGEEEEHEVFIYEAHDVATYLDGRGHGPTLASATALQRREARNGEDEREAAATTFTPEAIGSAIGIARNGLAVLERLDGVVGGGLGSGDIGDGVGVGVGGGTGRLIDQMLRRGHMVSTWKIGSSRGWRLTEAKMVAGEKKVEGKEEGEGGGGGGGVGSVMISRQGMWRVLLEEVVRVGGSGVIRKAAVKEVVIPRGVDKTAAIVLEDGTQETADLIVGADGLRSVVRAAMFPKNDTMKETSKQAPRSWASWFQTPPAAAQDYVTPHYEGLVGVSSFLPSSLLASAGHEPGTMSITFGPNGFFGHGFISTATPDTRQPLTLATAESVPRPGPTAVYWSTFASAEDAWPYHKGEARLKPKPQDFDRAAALDALVARHRHWKSPAIQAIVEYAKANPEKGIEGFYPTWTTPPLPNWHRGSVVLVGDAAHALQPSSGQGACQALEDAEVLARCLRHFLDQQRGHAVEAACEKYEQIRMPRVKEIYDRSQRMSGLKRDLTFVEEMLMVAMFKVMSLLVRDGYMERLVGYDLPAEVDKALRDP